MSLLPTSGPNWAPQDEGSVPGAIQCVNLHPQPISAAQLALHRSSYGIQGHRSGHSSTLPLPEDGYVQIPMAVKEAACAKLSIPWRPNLGIQRVSNVKVMEAAIVGSDTFGRVQSGIPTHRRPRQQLFRGSKSAKA